MKTRFLPKLMVIVALGLTSACQSSLSKSLRSRTSFRPGTTAPVQTSEPTQAKDPRAHPAVRQILDVEYEAYWAEVYDHFSKDDFAWIDAEADRVRASKERLPGGYWKLRRLYTAIEKPLKGDQSSDDEWNDLIEKLSRWSKKNPDSVTAKVALASAWEGYAWKARGGGYADTVSDSASQLFQKRLAITAQVLASAASKKQRCPDWYVVALWTAIGQGVGRDGLEKIFAAGVRQEPTYYYIYQVKASYLLPRWRGEEGEMEQFAEASARKLAGDQGNIIFFAIYSQMLTMHDMDFMNMHQAAVPRLIAGYNSLEKLYGLAPHRLNEACFFASFGKDRSAARKLFERVGDKYDLTVWGTKQTFELYRRAVERS